EHARLQADEPVTAGAEEERERRCGDYLQRKRAAEGEGQVAAGYGFLGEANLHHPRIAENFLRIPDGTDTECGDGREENRQPVQARDSIAQIHGYLLLLLFVVPGFEERKRPVYQTCSQQREQQVSATTQIKSDRCCRMRNGRFLP